jgi:hypothetical protein
MKKSIEPGEISIVGGWETENGSPQADAASRRIDFLIRNELERVAVSEDGWSLLFRHRILGNYWRLSYTLGETQGGGPARLDLVDPASWLGTSEMSC